MSLVAERLVLGELLAVRLELDRRERRGVGAEEELQQAVVAQLGQLAGGRLAATRARASRPLSVIS